VALAAPANSGEDGTDMKTAHLLLTVILLVALVASGQDCKPDDFASFASVKDAVRRVTTSHIYMGWDAKAFGWSGDMAAVAIVKVIPDSEMTSPDTLKDVLTILRLAFSCPSRCVTACSDRQPRVTMLLLEHLHNATRGKMQFEIDETKKFILQQSVN